MSLDLNKDFIIKFIKFACIGGLNTLITYALYYALSFYLSYQISFLISYIAGIVISYVLNSKLVFKQRNTLRGFFLYPLVYIVQYGVCALLLHFIIVTHIIDPKIAPLLITILLLPLTYIMSKVILSLGAR